MSNMQPKPREVTSMPNWPNFRAESTGRRLARYCRQQERPCAQLAIPFWTQTRPIRRVNYQMRAALQRIGKQHPDTSVHSSPTASAGLLYRTPTLLREGVRSQVQAVHSMWLRFLPTDTPPVEANSRNASRSLTETINECGNADIWPVLAQATSWATKPRRTHGLVMCW